MKKELLSNETSSQSRMINLRLMSVTKTLLIVMMAVLYAIPIYSQTAPAAPTSVSATPSAVCPSSPYSALKAFSAGNSIKWYVEPTGGTSVGTSASGANFNVTVSNATTYYAESVTTAGITSTSRTSISVAVNTVPEITSLPPDINQTNSAGQCGTVVNYSNATASGIPTPVISYSQSSGSNFDVGSTTVIVSAANVCATTSLSFDITVSDIENPGVIAPPTVEATAPAGAGSMSGIDLGTPVVSDNCGISDISNDAPAIFYGGNTTVTWTITDYHGNTAVATQTVTVTLNNMAPVISGLSSSSVNRILAAGTSTSLSVSWTDEAGGGPYTVEFNWQDGTSNTIMNNVSGNSASASHTYSASGVYEPIVTVTDGAGASSVSSFQYLSVYTTGNDFTTAGGYIMVPAGSMVSNSSLTGQANFGNTCKAKPQGGFQGEMEFNFKNGNMNFKTTKPTDWDYLVVSGCYVAIFSGTGTINGSGSYGILVAQTDKDRNPSNANKIRIKIWNKNAGNAVVFDTQMGDADNALPELSLSNGAIQIHTQNTCIAKLESESTETVAFHASAYPNPFLSDLTLKFSSESSEKVQIAIYDLAGKMVQKISDAEPNTSVTVQNNLSPGVYFVHAAQGDRTQVLKVVKNNK